MMSQADRLELIADKQYSSWKYKDAITQCINKQLWYDYIRFQHEPAALCSNDIQSCYDLIVILVAAFCLCCWGAPKSAVFSMIDTIHGLNHHIRMVYGDSQCSTNCKQWGNPIVGIGQGNSAGLQIWAVVSSPLFDIMCQDQFLTTIHSAMSLHKKDIVGFAFVDNTDLCISGPDKSWGYCS